MTAAVEDDVKPMESPSQPHLSKQDISKLDLNKITALTPEVVSRWFELTGARKCDEGVQDKRTYQMLLVLATCL